MIEKASEVQHNQALSNPFDWIAATGGPAVTRDGDYFLHGLPETWHSVGGLGYISLHIDHTEPNSGEVGTVSVNLQPAEGYVRWEACFLLNRGQEQSSEVVGWDSGKAADFNQAYAIVSAWRPKCVLVATGERLWGIDKGEVEGFNGGTLSFTKVDDAFIWRLDPSGFEKISEITGPCLFYVRGQSEDSAQMVHDA
jgi:hypothetical protein